MNIDEFNSKILSFCKLENKRFKDILQKGEDIKAFIFGKYENKKVILLTTNKRVIISYQGFVKLSQIEIPIEKINSIGQKKGLIYGEIHIWDSSSKISVENIPVTQIDKFIKATNEQINNYKSFKIEINKSQEKDITDKIEKLSELYKEGILTEYEFSTKKMELLEKLKK